MVGALIEIACALQVLPCSAWGTPGPIGQCSKEVSSAPQRASTVYVIAEAPPEFMIYIVDCGGAS